MYKLLRRISGSFSFTSRLDRDRADDAVNAPQIGQKRRMSDDDDADAEGSLSKRSRNGAIPELDEEEQTPIKTHENSPETESEPPSAGPANETEGVRQVTNGVKEVELEEDKAKSEGSAESSKDAPKAVTKAEPLPTPAPSPAKDNARTEEASADAPSTEAPGPSNVSEDATGSVTDAAPEEKPSDVAASEPDSEQTAVPSSPAADDADQKAENKLPVEPAVATHDEVKVIPVPVEA